MATVRVLTAARTLELAAAGLVNAALVNGELILTKQSGDTINLGNVGAAATGPAGPEGPEGPAGPAGSDGGGGSSLLAGIIFQNTPVDLATFLADYDNETGDALGLGKTISYLFTTTNAPNRLIHKTALFTNGKAMVKFIHGDPASNEVFTLTLKSNGPDNSLKMMFAQSLSTGVAVTARVSGQPDAALNAPSIPIANMVVGKAYAMVMRLAGNLLKCELWDEDPLLGGAPLSEAYTVLTGQVMAAFGQGNTGSPGFGLQRLGTDVTPYEWPAITEFVVVGNDGTDF